MSTKFGVIKKEYQDQINRGIITFDQLDEDDFIEVAFRSRGVRWTNELAPLLSDEIKVYPLDNTAQGIYTIGDIRDEIENGGTGVKQ